MFGTTPELAVVEKRTLLAASLLSHGLGRGCGVDVWFWCLVEPIRVHGRAGRIGSDFAVSAHDIGQGRKRRVDGLFTRGREGTHEKPWPQRIPQRCMGG